MTTQQKIKRLLDAHNNPAPTPAYKAYTMLHISDEAWLYLQQQTERHSYKGRGPGQGTSAYLEALFTANPTLDLWRDTRPDYMREVDLYRLQHELLPMWFDDNIRDITSRQARNVRADSISNILPVLLDLSDHFGIKSRTRTGPRGDTNCVLEAVGLRRLTPYNDPDRCPNERSIIQAVYRENRKRRKNAGIRTSELDF